MLLSPSLGLNINKHVWQHQLITVGEERDPTWSPISIPKRSNWQVAYGKKIPPPWVSFKNEPSLFPCFSFFRSWKPTVPWHSMTITARFEEAVISEIVIILDSRWAHNHSGNVGLFWGRNSPILPASWKQITQESFYTWTSPWWKSLFIT